MTTPQGDTRCANCDKIAEAHWQALADGRDAAAAQLTEALGRHLRSAHAETLSRRVAVANARSRQGRDGGR
ncbi:hypothetical protein ACFP1Z_00345 [Streptomyces gamaensis]|uniref:Uncharacterized protein n=1 Tax=Streptomyces gamaensis TaxID=1763542 RepID=A0ABW0YT50_9ACTN